MQDGNRCGLSRIQYGVVALGFLLLCVLYGIYVRMGYANLFFESQFLHFRFMQDLASHRFTAHGFFTAYYEHLFPGYNLILAFNYRFLHLWGGFDSVVYACFLIGAAAIVVWRFSTDSSLDSAGKIMAGMAAALLLLSTTNTPQWGMALSASGGVVLFTLCAALLSDMVWDRSWSHGIFALILIPLSIVVFCGGYGVGYAGALFVLVVAHVIIARTVTPQGLAILVAVVISAVLYAILVSLYGKLGANRPENIGLNIVEIGRFLLLITGSSVIGKAMFEQDQLLWPYYLAGVLLVAMTIVAWVSFLRRPTRGRMFVLTLSAYSAVNIAVVSFFRYRNGVEGAMGEWYSTQTHFIPVGVIYYCASRVSGRGNKFRAISLSVSVSILVFAALGYACDWRKGEYVGDYKRTFIAQAPIILAFPSLIHDKRDARETMLWDYSVVKPAVDFMYDHKLWIFHHDGPIVSGTERDGWMLADRKVSIVCPLGSSLLTFRVWRKEGWPSSTISVLRTDGTSKNIPISEDPIDFSFSPGIPAVLLNGENVASSNPMSSPADRRSKIGIISDVSCKQ